MNNSMECYSQILRNILYGSKIPHTVSYPVIRKEKEHYYLAVYLYYYSKEDVQNGNGDRPNLWVLADLLTGEILHRYDCQKNDFSQADFGRKYDNTVKQKGNKKFLLESLALLDNIRQKIVNGDDSFAEDYEEYLRRILSITPVGYQEFYRELSM